MSNIDRVPSSAPRARVAAPFPADRPPSADFPSTAGTAVLNLTSEQVARIRVLLVAMRLGRAVADEVRKHIIGLLNGGQRRMMGSAYFILSVRV